MNPKRAQVQEYILKYIKKITNSKPNVDMYTYMFNNMNDKDFDIFMAKLRDDKIRLCVTAAPGMDQGFSVENNFAIAKELKHDFFSRLVVGPSEDMPGYTTPNKYMILKLPVRRAAQLLSKKVSIPEDSRHVDMLTGQVAGPSRSAKLSYPELQILVGTGLNKSITELLKTRGGDLGELNAMNKALYNQGGVSEAMLRVYSNGVVSTSTLSSYFLGMGIRSTVKK